LARKGGAEHRLECRILSGEVPLTATEGALQPIAIDHAFQFPTKWWSRGRPRYVDVMARRGAVPWVVELKVGTAQGEYYRDGIVQAALYREFILRSPGLDPWFDHHGLNLSECRAALLIPPLRGPREEQLRADHQRVSRLFGVELIEEPAAVL
ncbi:MAG TPA: hypothetical protein VER33_21150, partial [Polyangiaceae bacterium]|nr:hypothetical protein [Polyangiaceae bacterium]